MVFAQEGDYRCAAIVDVFRLYHIEAFILHALFFISACEL